MSSVLEMALEALEWADNFHNEGEPVQVRIAEAIAALKEAIKQQELPELEAMEYWLKCNPPAAGAGYAVCWQAACKWQREAIKNQGEPVKGAYFDGVGVVLCGIGSEKGQRLYTSAQTIPEGWQLVPIEPTFEMQASGAESYKNDGDWNNIYWAMLSAAHAQHEG